MKDFFTKVKTIIADAICRTKVGIKKVTDAIDEKVSPDMSFVLYQTAKITLLVAIFIIGPFLVCIFAMVGISAWGPGNSYVIIDAETMGWAIWVVSFFFLYLIVLFIIKKYFGRFEYTRIEPKAEKETKKVKQTKSTEVRGKTDKEIKVSSSKTKKIYDQNLTK